VKRKINTPSDLESDSKFIYVAYALLVLVIIFFTCLHHYQPQILNVPSNTDISTWEKPAFEQTCIYGRMTKAEKDRVRNEGVPGSTIPHLLLYDILAILGAGLCFAHARKHYGFWMASCFLIGSFVFTGMQESMIILWGRAMAGGAMDPTFLGTSYWFYGTYWFPKGGLWFIETPAWVCLCWFIIAYSCVWVAGKVFPKVGLWGRAFAGGLIAMGLDLWVDPVSTSPELMSWVWANGDHIRILGIPHGNFLGWFFLIFLFAILWERYLPRLKERWGAKRAPLYFLGFLLIVDSAIFATLLIWGSISNTVIAIPGLTLPQGW